MTRIRQVFKTALTLAGLIALAATSTPGLIGGAKAQSATAALLAQPVSLPDMALGDAKAPVTIFEFASMSCPHCAAFDQNVFPMLRSKYIDTGKVRYVFREFPLDIKAASASVLARCVANGDAEKFFAVIDKMFKLQEPLMDHTKETMLVIGKEGGLDEQAVENCVGNQAVMDKISADETFAAQQLKVKATPTFFINGKIVEGSMSFEEFEAKLKPLLKK